MRRKRLRIMKVAVRLLCQRCGIRGSADLSFIWFAKTLKATRKDGSPQERTLWLCPDCANELGGARKCAAFLRELLKG